MAYFEPYSINIRGQLYEISRPQVMGILNVTPDSFYSGSRYFTDDVIRKRVRQIVEEGADMIDVGGYSSRANADDISPEEEYERLALGLRIIKEEAPDIIISVDSFRASVIENCHKNFGIDIVNDIAAGELDSEMIPTVGKLKLPYIMMHMRGNPVTMMQMTDYDDLTADILKYFSAKIKQATSAGICDIIIDPGFGFSKNLEQNYELLKNLNCFKALELPLLVGVSRKSMIYKLFGYSPAESLNGTTVINTISMLSGASIIRVHDVKQAVEAATIINKIK